MISDTAHSYQQGYIAGKQAERERCIKIVENLNYDVENMIHGIDDLWNLVEQEKVVKAITESTE